MIKFKEIDDKFKEIGEKIENLDNKINNIENKLDIVLQKIDNNIIPNTNDMKRHIKFIENVYSYVKSPLGFLCNRIYYFIGNKKFDLIKNNNNTNINLDIINNDISLPYDPNAFDKFK
jgi:hypothetical protein